MRGIRSFGIVLVTTCLTIASATATAVDVAGTAPDRRDRVVLKSGKELECRVLLELDDRVLILVGTRERWLERDDIRSIRSLAAAHRDLLERFTATSDSDIAGLLELADTASAAGLVHEARLLAWRVLLHDPQHDDAHERLGHKKSKRHGWRVPVPGGRATLEKAETIRADWGKAWELRSEHFAVRCDTGLRRTIDTLFELEFLYDAFYRAFQRDLELRHLTEPMQAYVYRDRKQFPQIGSSVGAFYSQAERILYTWIQRDGRPAALFHEGTHALLHHLGGNAARSRGSVPAWLDEAWADYMAGTIVARTPGRAKFVPDRRHARNLQTLRGLEDPYGVHRILNFKATDFAASSKQAMKYAQSYGIFLYCYEGAGRAHRDTFLEYLRAALAGKGQASTFRRLFRKELDAIESGHLTVE